MDKNTIPPITHPMGEYWRQPNTKDILIDDTHALMSQKTFFEIPDYTTSIPSGVYNGKMWRARWRDKWILNWFSDGINPDACSVNFREIILL